MCKELPLSNGQTTLIDDCDYERLSQYKWMLNTSGYVYREYRENGKRKRIRMHKDILGEQDGKVIDHINLDKLDNRRDNLRFCTAEQNNQNVKPRGGSSPYKGVYQGNGKWRTDIKKNRSTWHLGTYEQEIDASAAYNLGAIEIYGEFGRLNCPFNPGETYQPILIMNDQIEGASEGRDKVMT